MSEILQALKTVLKRYGFRVRYYPEVAYYSSKTVLVVDSFKASLQIRELDATGDHSATELAINYSSPTDRTGGICILEVADPDLIQEIVHQLGGWSWWTYIKLGLFRLVGCAFIDWMWPVVITAWFVLGVAFVLFCLTIMVVVYAHS